MLKTTRLRYAAILTVVLMSLFQEAIADSDSIKTALRASGIKNADSINVRVTKALKLLNDEHYLGPNGPTKMPPEIKTAYDLDSRRTPEQVLQQKVGGGCGSAALAFAVILEKSGIPESDIRIVGSVVDSDYGEICPKKGQPRTSNERAPSYGHVFVMVRYPDNTWHLINTSQSPRALEEVIVPDPEKIQTQMSESPVPVPLDVYKSMLQIPNPESKKKYGSGMIMFALWKPGEYPKHSYQERMDLIASGQMPSSTGSPKVCRYDPAQVAMEGTTAIMEAALIAPKTVNCVAAQ